MLAVDSRGEFEKFKVISEELIDLEVYRWLVRAGIVVRVGVLLLIDVHAFADFEQLQETVPHTMRSRGRREDGPRIIYLSTRYWVPASLELTLLPC